MKRQAFALPFFIFLWAWQAVLLVTWLHRDRRPAAWDQSVHLSAALQYKKALAAHSLGGLLRVEPWPGHPPYPPVAHIAMVPFFSLADRAGIPLEDAAAYANLFFLILLSAGAWLLASQWWGAGPGVVAAFLTSLAPPVLMYAREPLVDVGVAAWVVLCYACWVRSEHYSRLRWSLTLGGVFALGMLTKWTFFLYVLPVLVDAFWRLVKERKRSVAGHVLGAFCLAGLLCAPWYLVNLLVLLPRIARAASHGSMEGDPTVWTRDSWLWYPRAVQDHLFPVGIVLGLAGLAWALFRRRQGAWVLAGWLLSGYLVWSSVSNKDLRYLLPVLLVLPLSAAALPFGMPYVVGAAALAFSGWFTWAPAGTAYTRPPVPEAWPLESVVREVDEALGHARPFTILTLVANHSGMNGNNLRWTVEKLGLTARIVPRTKVERLGQLSEFVLVKSGDLGPPRTVGKHEAARQEALSPEGWFPKAYDPLKTWDLPDGSQAVLFQLGPSVPAKPSAEDPAVLSGLFPGLELRDAKVRTFPGPAGSSERTLSVSAREASFKGLILSDVRLVLEGFWAVKDDSGQPRILRLRRIRMESARLTEEAASEFLGKKVKFLKEGRVSILPDNGLEITGRAGPASLRVQMELNLSRPTGSEDPEIVLKGKKLQIFGVGLPFSRIEKRFALKPSRGMPFSLDLAGLHLTPGRFEAGGMSRSGVVEISQLPDGSEK